jgi:hypothetical protein
MTNVRYLRTLTMPNVAGLAGQTRSVPSFTFSHSEARYAIGGVGDAILSCSDSGGPER